MSCSTTTEATSARFLYAQPGAEQHCSRGPAGTDQRWRAATAGQVGCHTGGKNNTAAGTCHGGWRPEGGCTDLDVAVGGENEGNNDCPKRGQADARYR